MEWYQQGGRVLLIDEVHKYRHWSRELKNIYDGLPQLQIIFSASSALDLYRGEADLSRRVISYNLPGLSFREYLSFTEGLDFDPIGLDEIRDNHRAFSHSVLKKIQPLPLFKKYLRIGYLPITTEGEKEYLPKLEQIISTIIDTDLAYISTFNKGTAVKIKKMLAVIAESVPFKPNIAALARKLALSRESVYQFLYLLVDARLLNILGPDNKGVSRLQKPDKIYLENTNLIYALQEKPESGTIRATVVLNQLCNAGFKVTEPQSGDFLVGDLLMEVGGKGKKAAQVKQMEKYLVVADDIETGIGTQVPLWVFGFLY